jgi:hypothetical protein
MYPSIMRRTQIYLTEREAEEETGEAHIDRVRRGDLARRIGGAGGDPGDPDPGDPDPGAPDPGESGKP